MPEEKRRFGLPPAIPSAGQLHASFLRQRHPAQGIDEITWRTWIVGATRRLGENRTIESLAIALGLTWPRSRSKQVVGDFATTTLDQLRQSDGLGRIKLATLLTCLAFASGAYERSKRSGLRSEADEELRVSDRLITLLLGTLQPRDAEVIKRRYGLDGRERATLGAIGQDKRFRLSRERIRQVEAAALRQLRLSPHYNALQRALHRDTDAIWAELAQDAPVLTESQMPDAESRLAPARYFAIALVYRKLSRWLQEHATRLGSGWYVGRLSVADVRSLSTRLLEILKTRNQPVLFSRLCHIVVSEPSAVRVAVACSRRMSSVVGYVYEGSMTRRRRRRARLHRLLAQRDMVACVPGFAIADLYRDAYPDDPCSLRDLEIVMQDSPHLFLRCAEEGWITLTTCTPWPSTAAQPDLVRAALATRVIDEEKAVGNQGNTDDSDTTLSKFVRSTLLRKGPLHMNEIVALCLGHFGRSNAASSVPAMLIQGNYVRLAPGVWGLPHQVPLVSDDTYWSRVLLSETDCRMYTRSRHAGEAPQMYPMWTRAMEYEWVRWAQNNASPDLLSSLLVVADPTTWPVAPEVQRKWCEIQNVDGQYRLRDQLKYHLAEFIPTLKNLLRIASVAYVRGHISWVSANRVVGRRIDSHRPATSLAILIELGILESPAHWQERHVTTNACGDFVGALVAELHETGRLEWDSSPGREIARRVRRAGETPHSSWAPEPELLALRGGLDRPSAVVADCSDGDVSDAFNQGSPLDRGATTLNPDLERFLDDI